MHSTLLAMALILALQAVVVEHNITGATVVEARGEWYRGHLYPRVVVGLPGCSNASLAVSKEGVDLTGIALSSGAVALARDGCLLEVDGARLRGIAYVDDAPLVIHVRSLEGVWEIRVLGAPASPQESHPGPVEGPGEAAPRDSAPEVIGWGDGEVNTGVRTEILVGAVLGLILAASVVYEYALERRGGGAEAREAGDGVRQRR